MHSACAVSMSHRIAPTRTMINCAIRDLAAPASARFEEFHDGCTQRVLACPVSASVQYHETRLPSLLRNFGATALAPLAPACRAEPRREIAPPSVLRTCKPAG